MERSKKLSDYENMLDFVSRAPKCILGYSGFWLILVCMFVSQSEQKLMAPSAWRTSQQGRTPSMPRRNTCTLKWSQSRLHQTPHSWQISLQQGKLSFCGPGLARVCVGKDVALHLGLSVCSCQGSASTLQHLSRNPGCLPRKISAESYKPKVLTCWMLQKKISLALKLNGLGKFEKDLSSWPSRLRPFFTCFLRTLEEDPVR